MPKPWCCLLIYPFGRLSFVLLSLLQPAFPTPPPSSSLSFSLPLPPPPPSLSLSLLSVFPLFIPTLDRLSFSSLQVFHQSLQPSSFCLNRFSLFLHVLCIPPFTHSDCFQNTGHAGPQHVRSQPACRHSRCQGHRRHSRLEDLRLLSPTGWRSSRKNSLSLLGAFFHIAVWLQNVCKNLLGWGWWDKQQTVILRNFQKRRVGLGTFHL